MCTNGHAFTVSPISLEGSLTVQAHFMGSSPQLVRLKSESRLNATFTLFVRVCV